MERLPGRVINIMDGTVENISIIADDIVLEDPITEYYRSAKKSKESAPRTFFEESLLASTQVPNSPSKSLEQLCDNSPSYLADPNK